MRCGLSEAAAAIESAGAATSPTWAEAAIGKTATTMMTMSLAAIIMLLLTPVRRRQQAQTAINGLAVPAGNTATGAALREGMGLSILPCFMGDSDAGLQRYDDPRPEWDLGLWILLHPDLRRTARVLADFGQDFLLEP